MKSCAHQQRPLNRKVVFAVGPGNNGCVGTTGKSISRIIDLDVLEALHLRSVLIMGLNRPAGLCQRG